MPEPLDSRLRDDQALDEIELTSRLMIAASAKEGHLSQREVDELLGIVQAGLTSVPPAIDTSDRRASSMGVPYPALTGVCRAFSHSTN